MTIGLGVPLEFDMQERAGDIGQWISAWRDWRAPGQVEWHERHWRTMGTHRLPKSISFPDAQAVAEQIGEGMQWQRALLRYRRFSRRWPGMRDTLPRYVDVLAGYADAEFNRLDYLLTWIEENPQSNLYPRQLPITGVDTKWLEERKPMVAALVAAMQGLDTTGLDFFRICGLRTPPTTIRLRLLDPILRACAGGLGDITAPIGELAALPIRPSRLVVVENVQTGLAFGELPGAVVAMGLGYAVEILAELPWAADIPGVYWGDLDTHGFAILSHARRFLPRLDSVLMDESILLDYRELWGVEKQQHPAVDLPRLGEAEDALYRGLKENRWGTNVRLEQERIPWPRAWRALTGRARTTFTP